MSYCETIRGDVSNRKMYAGGLSYFSRGSVGSGLCGAVWPDAIGSTDSKARQMKKLVFDTIKTPSVEEGYAYIRTHAWRPSNFSTQTEHLVKKPGCQKFNRDACAASFETPLHRECAR